MNRVEELPRWLPRLIPTFLDVGMLGAMIFLVPWLGAGLFAQSAFNHLLLTPGFLLIPAGIVAIRCLPNYSGHDRKGLSFPALCLAFFQIIAFCLCYVYGTNIGGSESNNDGVAVIIFFVLLPIVMLAFHWPMTRAIPGTRKALTAEAIGLISVNYLTLIGAAVWERFRSVPTGENPVYATGISFLILFTILYLLFLAFFGLPRLYLLRSTGDRLGLTLYLLGVAVFLWNKLPPVN